MTLQAPAIAGASVARTATSELMTWLRGIGVRQVRLACGLVMFTYIFSHFFNHALGNVSLTAMEWWRVNVHVWWWRIPVVNATLYTAAIIHFSLGLWAVYQRRHFRYTAIEITQLLLGLSIPLWLASHFGAVRVAGLLFGRPPALLRQRLTGLLGRAPAYGMGSVHLADDCLDARLHRTVLLAAAQADVQMGLADSLRHCRADAVVRDGRCHPRCARSGRERQRPTVVQAECSARHSPASSEKL